MIYIGTQTLDKRGSTYGTSAFHHREGLAAKGRLGRRTTGRGCLGCAARDALIHLTQLPCTTPLDRVPLGVERGARAVGRGEMAANFWLSSHWFACPRHPKMLLNSIPALTFILCSFPRTANNLGSACELLCVVMS
jgi:hypothetical protein